MSTKSPAAEDLEAITKLEDAIKRVRSELSLAEDSAAIVRGFRSADRSSIEDAVALDIGARILETRLRQRIGEDPRLAASIAVRNIDGEFYAGSGRFWIQALAPEGTGTLDDLNAIIADELAQLVENGPTLDETERARRVIADRAQRRLDSSRAWAEALSRNEALGGEELRVLNGRPDSARAITAGDVRDAIALYSDSGRSFEIVVTPRRD